jgi:recombinational DNA repair protein (RecF pathway)
MSNKKCCVCGKDKKENYYSEYGPELFTCFDCIDNITPSVQRLNKVIKFAREQNIVIKSVQIAPGSDRKMISLPDKMLGVDILK